MKIRTFILILISIFLLIILNYNNNSNLLSYYFEKDNGEYIIKDVMPESGYDFDYVKCGNDKIKNLDVTYNKENNSITIRNLNETYNCNVYYKRNGEEVIEDFNIEYELNGGIANNPNSYKTNQEITLNNPTKTGYTFIGWTGSNGETPQKEIIITKGSTGDRKYIANYELTNYTINYELNGGTANNPTTYTIDTETFTLKSPTKEGYTFTGWTNDEITEPSKEITINKGSTGNKNYTANYDINTYEVNVTVLNGVINGESSKQVNYGSNTTFSLSANSGYNNPTVSCTNGASGSISNDVLTVSNVKSNTTCNVEYQIDKSLGINQIIEKYTEDNTEGLIKVEQPATEQMKSTIEYRYSGSSPRNYVTFNNETWRIIGVFDVDDGTGTYEKRIKIIKDASLESNILWDNRGENGINQWEGASLKTYLNETYYNGLTSEAKSLISDAKWYLGATPYDSGSNTFSKTSEAYKEERSTTVYTGDSYTRSQNWIGKIALMYPSDYGYASSTCYKDGTYQYSATSSYDYRQTKCITTNWLHNARVSNRWMLSPAGGSYAVRSVSSGGNVNNGYAKTSYSINPVVYLSKKVKIIEGDGTGSNPYQFSLE